MWLFIERVIWWNRCWCVLMLCCIVLSVKVVIVLCLLNKDVYECCFCGFVVGCCFGYGVVCVCCYVGVLLVLGLGGGL